MQFTRRLKLIGVALLLTPLAGCVHTGIFNDVPDCAALIPPQMRGRVPATDLPEAKQHADGHQDAEPWMQGFLGQTGQLDKANDRGDGIEHIYRTCLQQHRDALKRAKRKLF